MGDRIVERGSRYEIKKQLICDWFPDPESNIDYEYNLCQKGCDGKDVSCRFHPSYVPLIPASSNFSKGSQNYSGPLV